MYRGTLGLAAGRGAVDGPCSRLAAAKGKKVSYRDHNLNFENSGRNGHFSVINWSS